MAHTPGQPLSAVVQRVEIKKLRQADHLILGFSIGGGIDQDPSQNPFSQNKSDKGIYVTRVSPGGPADEAGLKEGDKIMQVCTEKPHKVAPAARTFPLPLQVNGWDMTMVTHDKARKKLTKKNEDVVRLLVTRRSLEEVVKQSMGQWHK